MVLPICARIPPSNSRSIRNSSSTFLPVSFRNRAATPSRSAGDSSEAERQSVAARFRELTGKEVELEFRIDRELLGGILAQIGSTVYDGSVRGNLARIREQLMAR